MKSYLILPLVLFSNIPFLFADFQLICPPDVTISCAEDLSDLNKWGRAYTDENGFIKYLHDCKIVYKLNDCGVGTITRTWGIENPENWQWLMCSQVITLSNANAFGYRDISFPPSITIESCNPEDSLKKLPRPYDKPSWKNIKCAKPMVSYSDVRYNISEGCVKIVRTWKVLDWCVYDPYINPTRGIFTGTQVIKLITIDELATIQCLKDTIVSADKECAGVQLTLPLAKVLSPCGMPYRIYNTSPYSLLKTDDASGFYPVGLTKFYFIAEYGCGSEIKCEVSVKVESKIQPTPYCLTGVVIDLMPIDQDKDGIPESGMVEVWASDLNKGSFHKCPGQKLRYSFSKDPSERSKIFTCDELGDNEVEIWVTDTLGNQDYCRTKIEIQNNLGIPNCIRKNLQEKKSEVLISLRAYNSSHTFTGIQLSLESLNDGSIQKTHLTNEAKYCIKDLSGEGKYIVHYHSALNDDRDLDAFDLKHLSQMVHGGVIETNPLKILAADLNSDSKIDILDLELLQKLIDKNIRPSELPQAYKLIPSGYVFQNSLNPFSEFNQIQLMIDPAGESKVEIEYHYIKTGDLSAFGSLKTKSKLSERAE